MQKQLDTKACVLKPQRSLYSTPRNDQRAGVPAAERTIPLLALHEATRQLKRPKPWSESVPAGVMYSGHVDFNEELSLEIPHATVEWFSHL